MTDNLTEDQRSYCMSRVKGRDNALEQQVRSALQRRGLRFRKHVRELPGTPDVAFSRARVAVFIDGDFWHGYRFPEWRDKLSVFWQQKIESNRTRDRANHRHLRSMGWVVIRLWQHEIEREPEACIARVCTAVRDGLNRN